MHRNYSLELCSLGGYVVQQHEHSDQALSAAKSLADYGWWCCRQYEEEQHNQGEDSVVSVV
jgi:hypothetical protein